MNLDDIMMAGGLPGYGPAAGSLTPGDPSWLQGLYSKIGNAARGLYTANGWQPQAAPASPVGGPSMGANYPSPVAPSAAPVAPVAPAFDGNGVGSAGQFSPMSVAMRPTPPAGPPPVAAQPAPPPAAPPGPPMNLASIAGGPGGFGRSPVTFGGASGSPDTGLISRFVDSLPASPSPMAQQPQQQSQGLIPRLFGDIKQIGSMFGGPGSGFFGSSGGTGGGLGGLY